MQLRSLRTTNKPRLMIIPMIDIIFFLLVFFMMSMLSMVVQKSVPVNLPGAQTAKVDIQKKVPITVTADGSVFVNDTKTNIDGMIKYLQIEQVKGTDMTVVLRADTAAQYGAFVQVLDTLKQMNITKIAIATESK
ncbi:ExbD/TolR family protein [Veillonella caviae]|uniref:ExbD/TolR family protein n=1 Tax=Veillonella caviae TaxID=248316 RepID=UPI0023527A85|nr:biopolymer transporter ExbD [Veillonella caviae]MCI5709390.1 biopolymer transporter ExbD [Veillonella caviae]MCI6407853.1 biopolymer transporter ExbD [Veillonella caviae]MDY4747081.1 biopolymer transporter ExbD [Veillonella caviae]MDY5715568.1 biopolymer transporter ExbD [Veillonella caviae]MDY6225061.1 biopolymer transporter ExbD [Veillonella caviae]